MSLYIPSLANDEFGPFVQGLADNFGELEGSLVEYGSNENGEYWRWEHGLLICYHQIIMTRITSSSAGEYWSFPVNLIAIPNLQATLIHHNLVGNFEGVGSNLGSLFVREMSIDRALIQVSSLGYQFVSTDELHAKVIGVGRWK